MILCEARTKGGAPMLGALHPGEPGPFGIRPHNDQPPTPEELEDPEP